MNGFKEMVKRYSIKQHHKINSLTTLLKELFGPCNFCYGRTEQDGCHFTISDNPEILEFYYEEKLYMKELYHSHPDLVRSGYISFPAFHDVAHLKPFYNAFPVTHVFIIVQNSGNAVEVFYFDALIGSKVNPSDFLLNLDILQQFTRYFKRESKHLLTSIRNEGFNIKTAKGPSFLTNDLSYPLSNKDPNIERFLKITNPLSPRERQCLQLFQKGKSAQATAAILGIKQRTVEYYFDNIKNKLGCYTKFELLEL